MRAGGDALQGPLYPRAGAARNNVAEECSNLILQSLGLVLDRLCSDAGTLFPGPARLKAHVSPP